MCQACRVYQCGAYLHCSSCDRESYILNTTQKHPDPLTPTKEKVGKGNEEMRARLKTCMQSLTDIERAERKTDFVSSQAWAPIYSYSVRQN